MARQSMIEDILDITSRLSWWIGVLLAAVSYVLLNQLAGMEINAKPTIGNMNSFLLPNLAKQVAAIFQYILPFVFLVGSGVSAYRRRTSRKAYERVSAGSPVDEIGKMSWQTFEAFIAETFRQKGFTVSERGGAGPDGGIDLVLTKDGEKHLVQCKHWRSQKVGVQIVRELYGVMAARGAVSGYVISSGVFTQPAKDFSVGRNIELVDGRILSSWYRKRSASVPEIKPAAAVPHCPLCNSEMVERTAKRGKNAGSKFWGCSRYPACKGSRSTS